MVSFDADRARRKLRRYLGDDPTQWDQDRFGVTKDGVAGSEQTAFIRLAPSRLAARDLSFTTGARQSVAAACIADRQLAAIGGFRALGARAA